MRTLYFLLPGTGGQFACGGLYAELKTVALAQQLCDAQIVTYQQRESGVPFLHDLLQKPFEQGVFVLSWGFHVAKLTQRLKRYPLIYHAHSSGYGFRLPSRVPIIAVSRNSMGYWGQRAPRNLIYYLPNSVSSEFFDRQQTRDIDVLVQARKSSHYLMHQLIPALRPHCRVEVIDRYVDDLAGLFNRTRLYLYDSAEYWALSRVTEGFGLPPMEAMACGAQVFSSVNSALADYLDPGFNGHKIGCYSTAYDVEQILGALKSRHPRCLPEAALDLYRSEAVLNRMRVILAEINYFFDGIAAYSPDVPPLSWNRIAGLQAKRISRKLLKKLKL